MSDTRNPTDPLFDFLWLSRPLMQQVESAVERGLRGTGLTVRMRAVLEILARDGPLTVPDLARHLEIQRQYVQVMVNETHVAGLTEKRANPRHKSSGLIALTARGSDMIDHVRRAEARLVADLSRRLEPRDIDAALSVARQCHSLLRHRNEKGML